MLPAEDQAKTQIQIQHKEANNYQYSEMGCAQQSMSFI